MFGRIFSGSSEQVNNSFQRYSWPIDQNSNSNTNSNSNGNAFNHISTQEPGQRAAVDWNMASFLRKSASPEVYASDHASGADGAHEPGSMVVTASTNANQASSLVNFALGQNGNCFILTAQASSGSAAASNLIRIVQNTRLSSNSHGPVFMNICLPFLSTIDSSAGVIITRLPLIPSFFVRVQSQPLQIEPGTSPFTAGNAICNLLLNNGGGPIDLVFVPAAGSAALQALAVARANLTSSSTTFVMFVYPPQNSSLAPVQAFTQVRIAFSAHALSPVHAMQFSELLTVQDRPSFGQQGQGLRGQGLRGQGELLSSGHLPDGFQQQNGSVSRSQVAASMAAQQQQQQKQQQAAAYAAAMGSNLTPHSSFGTGGGLQGSKSYSQLPVPTQTPAMPTPQQQTHQELQPQPSNKASRSKRADYVIVKNAAGALAKVLGRISHLGIACPLYTEKRSENFISVVGVGVKAIAVSRGYVVNENTGHEVAFQPYLRPTDRTASAPGVERFMMEKKLMDQLQPNQGMKTLIKSLENQAGHNTMDPESPNRDQMEMAFDVFKVPMPTSPLLTSSSPPKHSHSRVIVVSGIIVRLVDEAGEVELVTAGGKAMHVAMQAVIMARNLLKNIGCDILLLPRFHTVDTVSSHGYESVFLRFQIIRALPAQLPGDADAGGCKFIMSPVLV
eukprot:gene3191-13207_t